MRRRVLWAVCLWKALLLQNPVKPSKRSSPRSHFHIPTTVSHFDPNAFGFRYQQQPQCRRQVRRQRRGGIPQVITTTPTFPKRDSADLRLCMLADHPNGVVPASSDIDLSVPQRGNPFDSPLDSPLSASPSSSDEELFNHALALQTPMVPAKKPPPPPPPLRPKAGDS